MAINISDTTHQSQEHVLSHEATQGHEHIVPGLWRRIRWSSFPREEGPQRKSPTCLLRRSYDRWNFYLVLFRWSYDRSDIYLFLFRSSYDMWSFYLFLLRWSYDRWSFYLFLLRRSYDRWSFYLFLLRWSYDRWNFYLFPEVSNQFIVVFIIFWAPSEGCSMLVNIVYMYLLWNNIRL